VNAICTSSPFTTRRTRKLTKLTHASPPPLASPQNSGKLEAGTYCLNSNKGKKERIGRIMIMHANDRSDVKSAFAGDIIAIGGLKVGRRLSAGVTLFACAMDPLFFPRPTLLFLCSSCVPITSLQPHHPPPHPTPPPLPPPQDVITGETLCDEKAPIVLERMDFPDPVIKIAIEPKSKGDLEKMVGLGFGWLVGGWRGG
jgi:hypothetical protein